MEKERFKELCSHYFIGSIEQEELAELKSALDSNDAELRKIYFNMKRLIEHLPLAVEPVKPPRRIKEKILREIRKESINGKYQSEKSYNKFVSILRLNNPGFAFAIVLILFATVATLVYYSSNLTTLIRYQEKQLVQLKDELEKNRELLSVLQSKKIEVVIMNGLDVNPAGYGKIIWDPDRKAAILQISNLPAIAKDKDYQLWVIKDNKPISAGVFSIKEKAKQNFFKIEELIVSNKKEINAFAVTLEPKGGVPQPTGDMYLLGQPL
jgi:anti-sigma-K factor RskA